MKIIFAVVMLVASSLTWVGTMTKTSRLGVAADLPGPSLKWIHIAEGEFAREGLNLDKYRVSVVEEDDSVIVIILGLNAPKGGRGSFGPDLGYEVEISKKDLKVRRSNYIR